MQFNNAFFEDLGRSPGVIAVVDEATERVAEIARKDAPESSGDYRRGIGTAAKFQRRYVGLVVASDPKSLIIEAKTGLLARALRKAARRG